MATSVSSVPLKTHSSRVRVGKKLQKQCCLFLFSAPCHMVFAKSPPCAGLPRDLGLHSILSRVIMLCRNVLCLGATYSKVPFSRPH